MRNLLSHIDFGLLAPVVVLLAISLSVLFSLSPVFFKGQLIALGVALVAYLLFSNLSLSMIEKYEVPIYLFSLIILFALLIIGIESRGAVRWFEIFGFRIQFSEILKPFLAVSFASFLAQRPQKAKTFFLSLLLLLPIAFLIFKQPDLGNALIFGFVTLLTLLTFGFSYVWLFIGIGITAIIFPIFWKGLHDYQRQRLLTFVNPTKDPLGSSYNVIQSIIAIGSGMFFGKGISQGTQSTLRFLPERHTDFIFATISEDLGFFGALVIIACFIFLLYRIFTIFQSNNSLFPKIFSIIAFFIILVQFFINVGMNTGLLPIVGLTLPFVSYGGSSLLSNFILLGMLSSLSTAEKKRSFLEIR